jgi:hypothetical protein
MRPLLIVWALFVSACAHAPECAPACTPDPRPADTPIACSDVNGTGKRLCGYTDGKCVTYLIRTSCAAPWQWLSDECDGEETL